jgi:hypothetical protein
MSMTYQPSKTLDVVERVFDHADWEADSQQHLHDMADELSRRVGDWRVESASVHVYEKSAGTVTVKMVAGPE